MSFFRGPYGIEVYLEEGSVLGWIVISETIEYFWNRNDSLIWMVLCYCAAPSFTCY